METLKNTRCYQCAWAVQYNGKWYCSQTACIEDCYFRGCSLSFGCETCNSCKLAATPLDNSNR